MARMSGIGLASRRQPDSAASRNFTRDLHALKSLISNGAITVLHSVISPGRRKKFTTGAVLTFGSAASAGGTATGPMIISVKSGFSMSTRCSASATTGKSRS